jgi:hypothetical protein
LSSNRGRELRPRKDRSQSIYAAGNDRRESV